MSVLNDALQGFLKKDNAKYLKYSLSLIQIERKSAWAESKKPKHWFRGTMEKNNTEKIANHVHLFKFVMMLQNLNLRIQILKKFLSI